ncbi:MAG: hypothetical protein EXR49_09680 [Dehalococcoidia bacterium]|nr:hypothetical protein [Dehalococcoidia bacterium]
MMIARRVVAVVLGLVFIVGSVAFLILDRAHSTMGDPDFLIEEVRKADVFNFAYDQAAPLALAQVQRDADPPVNVTKVDREIIGAVRAMLPPEWLQEQSEAAIRQVVPYFMGREDTFSVDVPFQERFRVAGPGIKGAINTGRLQETLYRDVVQDRVEQALADKTIPFGITLTMERVIQSIRAIAPPDWIESQTNNAIDSIMPYLAGDTGGFTISIKTGERAEAVARELKALAEPAKIRAFVYDSVLDPQIQRSIGMGLAVPFALQVTTAEVQQAMRQALPPEWVDLQAQRLTDATVEYLLGRSPAFAVTVPLAERQQAAIDAVGVLADRKLATAYNAAPSCTPQQVASINPQDFLTRGIACRLPGVSIDDLKRLAGVGEYNRVVAGLVDNALPNSYTFSEADLRNALGKDQAAQVDNIRKWMREGFTFTEYDVEKKIAENEYGDRAGRAWSSLDDMAQRNFVQQSENVKDYRAARDRIRGGLHYTSDDLVKKIFDSEGQDGVDTLNDVRDFVSKSWVWKTWGWLMLAGLLGGIGLLAGRSIRGGVIWAASFVVVAALIMVVVSSVVSGISHTQVNKQFDKELAQEGRTELERLLLVKGQDVALQVADDFMGGLRTRSIVFLVVGVAAIGGAAAYPMMRKRKGSGGAPAKDEPLNPGSVA